MRLENYQTELTEAGIHYFEEMGLDVEAVKKQSGIFVKPCLDWTERTFRLGGNLGKAFFKFCANNSYIILDNKSRAVRLSHKGKHFFNSFVE